MRTINSFNINRSILSMHDYSIDSACPIHEFDYLTTNKTISNEYNGHRYILCDINTKLIFRIIHSRIEDRVKYHAHRNTIRNTNILKHKRTIKDYIRRI